IQLEDKWAYHCMVEYPVGSGVVKPGTDFIDLKDPFGVAKAETSAVGRALGLHGIAIEESVASAEEMARVAGTHFPMEEFDETTGNNGARIVDAGVKSRQQQGQGEATRSSGTHAASQRTTDPARLPASEEDRAWIDQQFKTKLDLMLAVRDREFP